MNLSNSKEYTPIVIQRDDFGLDDFGSVSPTRSPGAATKDGGQEAAILQINRSPKNLAVLRLNIICYGVTNFSPAALFPFFAIVDCFSLLVFGQVLGLGTIVYTLSNL